MNKRESEIIGDRIEETIRQVLAETAEETARTGRSAVREDLKSDILRSAAEFGIPIDLLPSTFRAPANKVPV